MDTIFEKAIPKEWSLNKEPHADELITAYEKGKEHFKKNMEEKFKNNITNAISSSTTVLQFIKDKGIEIEDAYIKFEENNLNIFNSLFIIKEDDFLSEKFKDVYNFSYSEKKKLNNDDFYISFSFLPFSGELDANCIASNNYFLQYNKE